MRTTASSRPVLRRLGVFLVSAALTVAGLAGLEPAAAAVATADQPSAYAARVAAAAPAAAAVRTVNATVLFDNEDVLDATARRVIRGLAAKIPGTAAIISVEAVGYVQFHAGIPPSNALAASRAVAVADFFSRLRPGGERSTRSGGAGGPTPSARKATLKVRYRPAPICPTLDLEPLYTFEGNTGFQKIAVKPVGGKATISYSELPSWVKVTATGLRVRTQGVWGQEQITVTMDPRDADCDTVTIDIAVHVNLPGGCVLGQPTPLAEPTYSFDADTGYQFITVEAEGAVSEVAYSELPDWIIEESIDPLVLRVDTAAATTNVGVPITFTAYSFDPSCEPGVDDTVVTVDGPPAACPGGDPVINLDITYQFEASTGIQTITGVLSGGAATLEVTNTLPSWIEQTSDGFAIDTDVADNDGFHGILVKATPLDGTCNTVQDGTDVRVNPPQACEGGQPTLDLEPTYTFDQGTGVQAILVTYSGGPGNASYSTLPSWIEETPDGLQVDTDLAPTGVPESIRVTLTPVEETCVADHADIVVTVDPVQPTCTGGQPTLSLQPTYTFDQDTGVQDIVVTPGGGASTLSYSTLPAWIIESDTGLSVSTVMAPPDVAQPVTVTATPVDETCTTATDDIVVTVASASAPEPCDIDPDLCLPPDPCDLDPGHCQPPDPCEIDPWLCTSDPCDDPLGSSLPECDFCVINPDQCASFAPGDSGLTGRRSSPSAGRHPVLALPSNADPSPPDRHRR